MQEFSRYAVYYAPPEGAFADLAAAWLGWDPAGCQAVAQPEIGAPGQGLAGLPLPVREMTQEPRRYGFHGTLKPPFRLAEGKDRKALEDGIARLAAGLAPAVMPGLELADLHGFLAFRPRGDQSALAALASDCVIGLDSFRAPPTEAEIARRNPDRLSPRQRALLEAWGYPWVMEEFRFHLTLTGRLEPDLAARAAPALQAYFAPVLPEPFAVRELCLFGQRPDGQFALIHRYALSG